MTRLDRYGDPIENDLTPETPLTRAEIHQARCQELRRILAEARERREATS